MISILFFEISHRFGGTKAKLLTFLKFIDKSKYKTFVLTNRGKFADLARELNVEVIELDLPRFANSSLFVGNLKLYRPFTIYNYFNALLRILNAVRKVEKDIDICQGFSFFSNLYALLIGIIFRKKIIWSVDFLGARMTLPRKIFTNIIWRFVDRFPCVSESLKHRMMEDGIAEERLTVIPSPIDTSRFFSKDKQKAKKSLRVDPDCTLIGYIGRLYPGKGVENLIVAAEKLINTVPDLLFIMVGEPETEEYFIHLCKLLQKRRVKKFFKLMKFREDVENITRALDIFVLPSIDMEGLPRSAAEASLCEVPVVVTDRGGAREIVIDEETGFVIPSGDINALVDRIIYLAKNKPEAIEMGKRGRRFVLSKSDAKFVTNELQKVYEDIIHNNPMFC
jgi:glycosyltransferase involved in cell wall biosynthesis